MMLLIEGGIANPSLRPNVLSFSVTAPGPNVINRILRIVFIRKGAIHIPPDPLYLFIAVDRCEARVGIGLVISRCPSQGIHKARHTYRRIHRKVVVVLYADFSLLSFFCSNKHHAKRSPGSIDG